MANSDHDDRELNEEAFDFYEDDSMYDELYHGDTFGERVDNSSYQDSSLEMEDDNEELMPMPGTAANDTGVEEGFGEAINPTTNPHIDDQMQDPSLSSEAEAEYNTDGSHDESLIDKAKAKIDEWTDKDRTE